MPKIARVQNFFTGCNSRLLIAQRVLPVGMSTLRPIPAKIIQHSEGLGAPSADTVRRRARELAAIDGREEFNEGDWAQAKQELHGGHESNDTNGEMEMVCLVSEHDMVAGSLGHHVENLGADDQNMAEELIAEGMDEAVHEQMLAARQQGDAENTED